MTRFVAEIGPAKGDLDYALDIVDAMADAGADVVKAQLYKADGLVTDDAPRYDNHEGTQHEAFQAQMSMGDWGDVARYCVERDIAFTASPFDLDSLDTLHSLHLFGPKSVPFIKIASGDITHRTLIEAAAATGIPLVLSTGAAYDDEIERALTWTGDADVTLLACTLSYPCPNHAAHVARMDTLRDYSVEVGYSDHTEGWSAVEVARSRGASLVEKHVTLTPGEGGDHDFAATPAGVRLWTQGRAMAVDETVVGDGHLIPRDVEMSARLLARRSVCAAADLPAGHVLGEGDVTWLRPATGIDPWVNVSGATLKRPVRARTTLTWDDLT